MSNDVGAITLASGEKRKPKKKRDRKAFFFKVCFLLPAVAFLLVFMYYPIVDTFRLSLMRATGLGDTVFIGLENYAKLFKDFINNLFSGEYKDIEFQAGFVQVFAWAFWSVVIQIPLAFFVAFSLSAYKNRVTGPLRAIYYLAYIMPSVITAMLGKFVFAPRYGVIATISEALQKGWLASILPWWGNFWEFIGKIDFLGDPRIAFWSVFAVATWAYSGFGIVYLMANIEQIPLELREASSLDGANRWQYARHIVLPMLNYPLRIMAILCVVGSLKLFEMPWLLTAGGPGYATQTLGITLYKQGFVNWQYGRAAAIGVVIFLCSLIFSVIQFSFQRKEGELE